RDKMRQRAMERPMEAEPIENGVDHTPKAVPAPTAESMPPLRDEDVPAPPVRATVAATGAVVTRKPLPVADLGAFLVNFVVEQTGYPPEVVELDADLEADL